MKIARPLRVTLLTLALASVAPAATPMLTKVASFDHQVTGVTISKTGRIFVNFPRWTEDAPVSVGEVDKYGETKPYPDGAWNNWRNAKKDQLDPAKAFICVQSVVVDPNDQLWVLDAAAPGQGPIIKGGPKLVRIDLGRNEVAQTIQFDESIALTASYLNDVRFSPDAKTAYLTDSGGRGALIVVDLTTGTARRVLDGHPSTQPEPNVKVTTDHGKPVERPDGRTAVFAADGIAISKDGKTLYWQALTGKTLYRIATDVLNDAKKTPDDVANAVEKVGVNGISDGLIIDDRNRMFISALEEDAIKMRDLDATGDDVKTVIQDERLRWPDTFSIGPDGMLFVTTSHIQDMSWFKPKNPIALMTELWKLDVK